MVVILEREKSNLSIKCLYCDRIIESLEWQLCLLSPSQLCSNYHISEGIIYKTNILHLYSIWTLGLHWNYCLSMHCYVTLETPQSILLLLLLFLNTSYSLVLCTLCQAHAAALTPAYLVKIQPVVQNVVRRLKIKALLDFRKRANS